MGCLGQKSLLVELENIKKEYQNKNREYQNEIETLLFIKTYFKK